MPNDFDEPTMGLTDDDICRIYDVPPWLLSRIYHQPRFAKLRWALRHVWPVKAKLQ